jgi:MFS family permease
MAALADAVGSAHIGEATGWVAIALNAGSLIAPLVGGSIFERSGYHAVYALIMAVLVLDVVFRFIMKERLGAAINNPLDVTTVTPRIGSIHSKPAEIKEQFSEEGKCDKFPESQVQEYDLEAGSDQSAAAAGVDNKAVEWTKGRTVPVILQMLFVPRMIAASWGILALAGVLSGFQTILPLVVHKIFGWNAEGGGLVFLPLTVPALLGPFVGRLTDRFGGRWFSFLSFLFMAPSLILLRLVEDNSIGHKIMLCTLLTCIGSCSTLALEPLFAEITKVADEVHASSLGRSQPRQNSYLEAYALFSTAWGAGDVVGPFLAGFILNAAGWRTTTWVLGLLAGVSAIPAVLFCDGYIWSLPPRRSSSSV